MLLNAFRPDKVAQHIFMVKKGSQIQFYVPPWQFQ